jgi:hypothetical protein
MRRLCLSFHVLVFFALTGSVRAQYAPLPPYNYGYSPYYPAPQYYNNYYYANRPLPQYPVSYYSPPAYYGVPANSQPVTPQPQVRQTQNVALPIVSAPADESGAGTIVTYPLDTVPPPSGAAEKIYPEGKRPFYLPGSHEPPGPAEPIVLPYSFWVNPVPAKCFWLQSEYLLWNVRSGSPHYPLVTTDSNPGQPLLGQTGPPSGSLASPTATVIFGSNGFDYPALSGTRLSMGTWFGEEQRFGLEGSAFYLWQRTSGFTAGSDSLGNPPLYVPAFNSATGAEGSLTVSDPTLPVAGTIALTSTISLWGAEMNSIFKLTHGKNWDVELLAGFRYLNMTETFELQNTSTGLGSTISLEDRFQAENQFFGGQVGARFNYSWYRLTASLTAKVAMGDTHENVDINGSTTTTTAGVSTTTPGGFFTQASNLGPQRRDLFAVVPQASAMLGFNVTQRLTMFAGFDFLYWNPVTRAGDQVDRVLNLTQSPAFNGGVLVGANRPEPMYSRPAFYADGLSLGVQYRY